MLGFRLLAAPLVGLALFSSASAAGSPDAAITSAAVAPYRDVLLRDAGALCADLTRSPTIIPSAQQGAGCEQAVEGVFSAVAPESLPPEAALSLTARARHLEVDGDRATGIFSLVSSESATARGSSVTALVSLGSYQLSLEEVAGRWLVSSQAQLAAIGDCEVNPHRHCHAGVKQLVFLLGLPEGQTPEETIPTPIAVQKAGARTQREFAAGREVLAQTGCLACHKIGAAGNSRPGQNLTHIGSQLSSRQIERALLSPPEPMPSFKHLPPKKLHEIVRFLSLMR